MNTPGNEREKGVMCDANAALHRTTFYLLRDEKTVVKGKTFRSVELKEPETS
jgi:hypothetical protein